MLLLPVLKVCILLGARDYYTSIRDRLYPEIVEDPEPDVAAIRAEFQAKLPRFETDAERHVPRFELGFIERHLSGRASNPHEACMHAYVGFSPYLPTGNGD